MKNSWFIVVNPRAGGGKGRIDWPTIEGMFVSQDIPFNYAFTEYKHHAVELTVSAIKKGYRKIIAMGGDGTLNEVVNGAFIQKHVNPSDLTIGVIAVGTGNDWVRTYNLLPEYSACVNAIKTERLFRQDVGKVEYWESKIQHTRYFINAAGIGFDAEVASRTNHLKDLGRKGTLLYIVSLLRALVGYHHTSIKITVDNSSIHENVFSLTLGIGKYNGAGMMQVPNAVVDDGLFDITVIRKISKLGVILNISRLYNGTILKHPKIESLQGEVIEISSEPPVKLETDGESLGESPFRFSIIPQAINVVVGEGFATSFQKETELCAADAI